LVATIRRFTTPKEDNARHQSIPNESPPLLRSRKQLSDAQLIHKLNNPSLLERRIRRPLRRLSLAISGAYDKALKALVPDEGLREFVHLVCMWFALIGFTCLIGLGLKYQNPVVIVLVFFVIPALLALMVCIFVLYTFWRGLTRPDD
jgi:hypothetical protein